MGSGRYSASDVIRGLMNPRLAVQEIRRLARASGNQLRSKCFRWRYGSGRDVMEEDWDNLILLDACRYDFFATENTIPGELERAVSGGNTSWEFMEANFLGRELHDTIYVTANPHVERLPKNVFFTVDNTYRHSWNENLQTVLPEDVAASALETHQEYDHKRLVVHFMQPHQPFIGPTADKIREKVEVRGWDKYHKVPNQSSELSGDLVWEYVKDGQVSHDEIRQAYRESLNIALAQIERLVSELNGKTVISSDHGELLGERALPNFSRWYGHPSTLEMNKTCFVPWHIVPSKERRETVSESPLGFERLDDNQVEDRLSALGYK